MSNLQFDKDRVFVKVQGKKRAIGTMIAHESCMEYQKTITDEHIMKVNNSVGINYDLLHGMLDCDDRITIHHGKIAYKISVSDARKHGKPMHFKKQGFELQVFIPLSCFEKGLVTKQTGQILGYKEE